MDGNVEKLQDLVSARQHQRILRLRRWTAKSMW